MPKRESELARPRSRNGKAREATSSVTKGELMPVKIPNADRDWHPIARRFWNSLKTSGQSDFYQDSDWAFAYSLCDDLSHYKKPLVDRNGVEYVKRSPEMLKAIYTGMERLLVTEGDRRRVRIELTDPNPEQDDATVLAIADYRADLGLDPEGD
jgi:hypothetical protein